MTEIHWETHGPRFLEVPRHRAPDGLESGTVVIFGVPYDGTASFRPGARFGPDALRAASLGLETYSPNTGGDLAHIASADAGNLDVPFGAPEPVVDAVRGTTQSLLEAGLKPLLLGGEHTVSIGAIQAAAEQHPDLVVVQLDAHADLRETYLGDRLNHACTMRRVLEHIAPERLLQAGIRSGTREEFQELQRAHRLVPARAENLARRLADLVGPIYLTIDLDIFDPALLPGTGTPEPGGIDWATFAELLDVIPADRLVAADVVELAPRLDASEASALLGAKVVRELALKLGALQGAHGDIAKPGRPPAAGKDRPDHWIHPAIAMRDAGEAGLGCMTTQPLKAGTVVTVWGGNVVDGATLAELSNELRTHAIQVDDNHFMVPRLPLETTDYVNHSCNPTCGIRGQVTLVTLRDLDAGEPITFDYAMSDSTDYDEFDCLCGASTCRGRIRGDDWQRPELQERYRGYFSAYLERRIAKSAP